MRRLKDYGNDKMLLTVRWENGTLILIDQTKLPTRLVYVKYNKYQDVANAIKSLIVRGAPAIGVAAAFGRSEERRVGKECRSRWSPYH